MEVERIGTRYKETEKEKSAVTRILFYYEVLTTPLPLPFFLNAMIYDNDIISLLRHEQCCV